jgi:hypothetical protein
MARYLDIEEMEKISKLQEETDSLRDQLRAATKKHNDTVEQLEDLLALALKRVQMTRKDLEKALEKEREDLFEKHQ